MTVSLDACTPLARNLRRREVGGTAFDRARSWCHSVVMSGVVTRTTRVAGMRTTMTALAAVALASTLGLAGAFWIIAIRRMDGMDMGVATTLGSFKFFLPLWVSMMAAMMLPGTVPAVLRRAYASGRVSSALLFVLSYLAI